MTVVYGDSQRTTGLPRGWQAREVRYSVVLLFLPPLSRSTRLYFVYFGLDGPLVMLPSLMFVLARSDPVCRDQDVTVHHLSELSMSWLFVAVGEAAMTPAPTRHAMVWIEVKFLGLITTLAGKQWKRLIAPATTQPIVGN